MLSAWSWMKLIKLSNNIFCDHCGNQIPLWQIIPVTVRPPKCKATTSSHPRPHISVQHSEAVLSSTVGKTPLIHQEPLHTGANWGKWVGVRFVKCRMQTWKCDWSFLTNKCGVRIWNQKAWKTNKSHWKLKHAVKLCTREKRATSEWKTPTNRWSVLTDKMVITLWPPTIVLVLQTCTSLGDISTIS